MKLDGLDEFQLGVPNHPLQFTVASVFRANF